MKSGRLSQTRNALEIFTGSRTADPLCSLEPPPNLYEHSRATSDLNSYMDMRPSICIYIAQFSNFIVLLKREPSYLSLPPTTHRILQPSLDKSWPCPLAASVASSGSY
jgi:hypothetical protein